MNSFDYWITSFFSLKVSNETRNVFSQVIGCYSEKATTGEIVLIPQNESIPIEWGTKSILQANLINYKKLLTFNQVSDRYSHLNQRTHIYKVRYNIRIVQKYFLIFLELYVS